VVINPVLDIGCREGQGAPAGGEPTANSEPAGAPREAEPATRNSTVVRYDPRRVAVTFKQGVTRARIRAVISDAAGTIEAAVPQINAYLVGVEPERRAETRTSGMHRVRTATRSAPRRRRTMGPQTLGELPFTGLGLLLFVLLGLALFVTGLTTRTRARLSV
jgi:hypothetical protein